MGKSATRTAEMAQTAEDAVIIEGRTDTSLMQLDDVDTEDSWDSWIEGLRSTEATGMVRVYKLPLDAAGNPTMTKGAKQIQLFSCPHQQYTFDDLIVLVKERYMMAGELATIRITGTRSGQRGVMFNRIISVQREAGTSGSHETPSQLSSILATMQQAQQRHAELMERILRPDTPPVGKPFVEVAKEWSIILAPILTPIFAAVAARIVAPPPKSDIESTIGAVLKLKDLADDFGSKSNGDDDGGITSIIKAVAPDGLKLLTTLAANAGQHPPPRPMPRRINATPAQPVPPVPREDAPPATTDSAVQPASTKSLEISPENEAMLAQLKPQLEQLVQVAEQGADPAEVAKLVIDMLPETEQVDEQVYSIVSNPAAFNRLALLSPGIAKHAEWFERLRVALVQEFDEPDKVPETVA